MANISLLGVPVDIEIHQGSSVSIVYELRDENGVPLDLTDWDLRAQVRQSFSSSSTLINCTLANSKLIWVNRTAGKFALELLPIDTAAIKFAQDSPESLSAVYDIEVIAPITSEYGTTKPWYGNFTILREVTR